jgi:hypothetical protein
MTIHEIYSRGRVAQLKEALARAERSASRPKMRSGRKSSCSALALIAS